MASSWQDLTCRALIVSLFALFSKTLVGGLEGLVCQVWFGWFGFVGRVWKVWFGRNAMVGLVW